MKALELSGVHVTAHMKITWKTNEVQGYLKSVKHQGNRKTIDVLLKNTANLARAGANWYEDQGVKSVPFDAEVEFLD